MCDAIAPLECGERYPYLNKNYFIFSIIFPYFNTPTLHKIIIRVKITVCLETHYSKTSYCIETSQLICNDRVRIYVI